MAYVPSSHFVPAALKGDVRAVSRLLSRAEAGRREARAALDEMFRHAGKAHVVGVTGVPGSGKSTLVASLAASIRASGRSIAIVAVDPSSPFSGGSILGDRIRMGGLAGDPGVFVRSMATRGALGGIANGTLEAVDVLDAAGYDVVVIETVGVGQDEVEVARAAHTTIVVSAPGLGDDVQAIKAGILEIADIHVVSKCDRPDANRTIADLKSMLGLGVAIAAAGPSRWPVPVIATASLKGEGVAELATAIDRHRTHLDASGEIAARRDAINERRMLRAGEEILRAEFERRRHARVSELLARIAVRSISPHHAARELLGDLNLAIQSGDDE